MARSLCHSCGEPFEVLGQVGRRDECANCSAELHCCLMCRHYDVHAANSCREPHAEVPREKNRANFCDFFSLGEGGRVGDDPAEAARRAFDALFAKK